ncbi:MAG TPA: GNAT family N-acetyltransferase [Vicinamibacteria bacterium]|nr:GNAT family N-acetyltransferase [Vicinamibacteria bacterium]
MDVRVRQARERADFDACVRLQREVWGLSDLEITSAIQLVATVHAGGLLLVAEGAGEVVGFCYAFAALRGGEAHLHSDMLAVRPAARGLGVGLRLKWAQREEALRRGLRHVTWTFDALRARNARLNLHHLGATAREVLPDFYGSTSSALHHGLATDRLLARWDLGHPHVARRAAGEPAPPPDLEARPALNEVTWRGGLPVSSPPRFDREESELLLEIPEDWDAVVRAGAGLAGDWQGVVRQAFQSLFARGYAATGFASTGGARPRAGYILRRGGLEG